MGLTVSDYVRQAVVSGKVAVKQVIAPGDTRILYNALNNLNQAQKLANTFAQKEDSQAVLTELSRVIVICEATRAELLKFMEKYNGK